MTKWMWNQKGATSTEYMVLLVLIACFVLAGVKLFGSTVSSKYNWANQGVYKNVDF